MNVFISHASEDRPLAKRVADVLQDAGFEVWDDRQVLPGDNWAAEMGKALENAEAMVVLITPASLKSDHVQSAISYALGTEAYRHRVIPVLTAPMETLPKFPWILKKFPIVDLTAFSSEREGLQKIAVALQDADLEPS